MKNRLILAIIPAALALAACSEATKEEVPAAEAADDNDTAEPVPPPVTEEEPHDETEPHKH